MATTLLALVSHLACNEILGNRPPGDAELGGSSAGGLAAGSGGESASGGAGAGGSGTGGVDGTGGTGGTLPVLDAACTGSGELACAANGPAQKLVCSQGVWESNGSCDDGDACNPATGLCSTVLPECAGRSVGDRFCNAEGDVAECGVNLVSATVVEDCEGSCVAGATAACVSPDCGDGQEQSGEECDDGNMVNDDACTELCQAPFCGDGFSNGDEECDDGDTDNTDDCTEQCLDAECGDGYPRVGEQCDDGNESEVDGCTSACQLRVQALVAGGMHTCVLLGAGQVKCWGDSEYGQLGIGTKEDRGDGPSEMGAALPFVNLGTGLKVVSLALGDLHSCALLDDGRVKCWGRGSNGALGLGDADNRGDGPGEMGDALPFVDLGTGRTATALSAGTQHSCAILDDESLKCWGYNLTGSLGLGDPNDRGDAAGEMGDNLPAVDLGAGRTATAVSAGFEHTCALLDDGAIKCWGRNEHGQLGLGAAGDRGDQLGEMGDALATVELGTGLTAVAVETGFWRTCALSSDATVKCWGFNESGALGLGDTDPRGLTSVTLGDDLPAVSLGSGRTVVDWSVNSDQSCVILDDASLKCWGQNGSGQLGLGDSSSRGDDTGEMGNALPAVLLGTDRTAQSITVGSGFACALLDDATVRCWGAGGNARLGLGDSVYRGDDPGEMGDNLPPVSLW